MPHHGVHTRFGDEPARAATEPMSAGGRGRPAPASAPASLRAALARPQVLVALAPTRVDSDGRSVDEARGRPLPGPDEPQSTKAGIMSDIRPIIPESL